MRFLFATGLFLLAFNCLNAQDIQLVNSGQAIDSAKKYYDADEYAKAENELKKIDPRDTNYVYSLSELARVYLEESKFQDAVSTCQKGLQHPNKYCSSFIYSLATAQANNKQISEARATLWAGIKRYPFDYLLPYAMGRMYYENKMLDSAVFYLSHSIELNPFLRGPHYYLGSIAILRGERTRAMMSLGMYLALFNSANSALVLMENMLNDEVENEGTESPCDDNSFERLDQIIRARIAMDEKFKSPFPFHFMISNQFILLFDQLSTARTNQPDIWSRYYLPFFQAIHRNHLDEAFVYYILHSSGNKEVLDWEAKNEKNLVAFDRTVNELLTVTRKKVSATQVGFVEPVTAEYYNNNRLEALGERNGKGNRVGRCVYLYENGEIQAEGSYDPNGVKQGLWIYYDQQGSCKSRENSTTGEITKYFPSQKLRQHYFIKDGKQNGLNEAYFECGALMYRANAINGLYEGPGVTNHPNGKVAREYNYHLDSLNGDCKWFYDDGSREGETVYKMGRRQGLQTNYYRSGGVESRVLYVDDLAEGTAEYFYPNGKLKSKGQFKENIATGMWEAYDPQGLITERWNRDENGKLHGDDEDYSNGITETILTYEHGKLIKSVSYDRSRKLIATYGDPGGTFDFKGYYITGKLQRAGRYVNGLREGKWNYYSREGFLTSTINFSKDDRNDSAIFYYANGHVKDIEIYDHGALNGFCISYYKNGSVKSEGWFVNGKHQQRLNEYFTDHTLQFDTYYVNGKRRGEQKEYGADGKLVVTSVFDDNMIANVTEYGHDGNPTSFTATNGDTTTIQRKSPSGEVLACYRFLCNRISGIETFLPGGTRYYSNDFVNGNFQGDYRTSYITGKPATIGSYANDLRTGRWKGFYENGNPYYEGNYVDGELDSIWTYYYYDGTIRSKIQYQNDKENGVSQIFAPSGGLVLEKKYEEGDLVAYRFPGKDQTMGDWIDFSGSGEIIANYPGGGRAIKESYTNGTLNGIRQRYYSTGKLHSEESFAYGDWQGKYTLYYPSGKVMQTGSYLDDNSTGLWEYYDPDGRKTRTEQYEKGFLHGECTIYEKSGLARKLTFVSGRIIK